MKKIKNGIMAAIAATAGVASLGGITSCSKPMYSTVKHIAPYLHEITYKDYRYDENWETIKEAEPFGCSSVRNGNFYGRNFDYVFNDTPEFIVRVKADKKKHRHESIAVATHFGLRENKLLDGKYDEDLELIPNLTMDGINDAGVICSCNVVSMEPNVDGITPETKPNDPNAFKLHCLFIARYVIDNASSAKNAVELLTNNVNIVGDLNGTMDLHTMIADKNDTYIVEYYKKTTSTHNHFDVVARKINPDEERPIMTNYYCNYDSIPGVFKGNKHDEKFGNERFEILKKHYADKRDEEYAFNDMVDLMKKVKFSQAFEYMHNPVPINAQSGEIDLNAEWYSEKLPQSKLLSPEPFEDWEEFSHQLDDMKRDYWIHRILDIRNPANSAFWITTHNSTYDLEEKRLQVIVQEDYTHTYDYYL